MLRETPVSATRHGPDGRTRSRAARKPRRRPRNADLLADRHILYEAAVQSPEEDVDFLARLFRRHRGRPLRRLREDFCGTAALSTEFVGRHADNLAWGVDIHAPTLQWGAEHHRARLGEDAGRLALVRGDVLTARTPKVDLLCAFNFSYWIFKERAQLLAYFRRARHGLRPDGLFVVDVFGGQEAMGAEEEKRRISGQRAPDGRRIPAFTYVWDQASFNIVDHAMTCHIHFELPGGRRLRRAFSYDWRLWTVPEVRDLMTEAGFRETEVYLEGWDDEADEADGVFRRRKVAENQAGWVGYVVGIR